MTVAVYPGSFDPVTLGHMDIIGRTARMMDRVVVGVLQNSSKTPLFSVEERVRMLQKVTSHLENVEIRSFDGLLVDFVHACHANVIVRGLRAITDFEYELQMAHTNRVMAPDIDTVFLTTNLNYSYVSSTIVKEIASFDGNLEAFLHPEIAEMVREKSKDRR
ncbi:pantetheine-phosphate adenylyltransferase [Clostridiaceae bacterium]|nr:pantetheine-phosphate adenylyltransferase [Clostridiaceae bacterium]RKI13575.1 pantetheine-phosphate adenylyltransferase [bacterium 1XD21-70]